MIKTKKITLQEKKKIGKKLKVDKELKMELEEILGSQLIKNGNGGYGEYKSKGRSIIRKNRKK